MEELIKEIQSRLKRSQEELLHSQARNAEWTPRMHEAVGYQEGLSQVLEILAKIQSKCD
jgi:hypothetical protein